jgi:hypothetical protein
MERGRGREQAVLADLQELIGVLADACASRRWWHRLLPLLLTRRHGRHVLTWV